MQTKSAIQLECEKRALRENFKEGVSNLLNTYNIEDAVLTLNENEVAVVTRGYFVTENEYKDFNESMKAYNPNEHVLRIVENNTFQIGKLYKNLSDCPTDARVFDVESLNYTDEI